MRLVLDSRCAWKRCNCRWRPAQSGAVNDALFKLLDTDGDGKLSKKELAAAADRPAQPDRNDDEMITPHEIVPASGAGNVSPSCDNIACRNGRLVHHQLVGTGRQWSVLAGLIRRPPGPTWPGGCRRNTARATGQTGADQADAQASRPGGSDIRQLDVDGDGLLDAEELARFAQRPPDLELKVDLGKKAAVAARQARYGTGGRGPTQARTVRAHPGNGRHPPRSQRTGRGKSRRGPGGQAATRAIPSRHSRPPTATRTAIST